MTKQLTRKQNREAIDVLIMSMCKVIDNTLRTHGKQQLTQPDEYGVLPIDRLFAPLRKQYEDEMRTDQPLYDYLADPSAPETDKRIVLVYSLSAPLSPSLTRYAQDAVSIWTYQRYAYRMYCALRNYAKQQGLTDEDIYRVLPSDGKKAIEETAYILGKILEKNATKR